MTLKIMGEYGETKVSLWIVQLEVHKKLRSQALPLLR